MQKERLRRRVATLGTLGLVSLIIVIAGAAGLPWLWSWTVKPIQQAEAVQTHLLQLDRLLQDANPPGPETLMTLDAVSESLVQDAEATTGLKLSRKEIQSTRDTIAHVRQESADLAQRNADLEARVADLLSQLDVLGAELEAERERARIYSTRRRMNAYSDVMLVLREIVYAAQRVQTTTDARVWETTGSSAWIRLSKQLQNTDPRWEADLEPYRSVMEAFTTELNDAEAQRIRMQQAREDASGAVTDMSKRVNDTVSSWLGQVNQWMIWGLAVAAGVTALMMLLIILTMIRAQNRIRRLAQGGAGGMSGGDLATLEHQLEDALLRVRSMR